MKQVSVDELNEMIQNNEDFQLIDVREPHEFNAAHINGELISLQTTDRNV